MECTQVGPAQIILRGVAKKRTRIFVGLDAKLIEITQRLFPQHYSLTWPFIFLPMMLLNKILKRPLPDLPPEPKNKSWQGFRSKTPVAQVVGSVASVFDGDISATSEKNGGKMWNFRKPMSIFGNSLRQILLDWRTPQVRCRATTTSQAPDF